MSNSTCNVDIEVVCVVAIGSLSKASIQTRIGWLHSFDLQLIVPQAYVVPVNQWNEVFSPGHFLCFFFTFAAQFQLVPRIESEWRGLHQGDC